MTPPPMDGGRGGGGGGGGGFNLTRHSDASIHDALSNLLSQGKIFLCQHCNIIFIEYTMYLVHISLHSSDNPWKCTVCGKECGDRYEFGCHGH